MAQTYPELPPEIKKGFKLGALKYFGAGAIIASVTIGSGETLFASRGGAIFGYTLLWCFVGSAVMKAVPMMKAVRVASSRPALQTAQASARRGVARTMHTATEDTCCARRPRPRAILIESVFMTGRRSRK